MEGIMASCPSGFVLSPTYPLACVVECPSNRGFETRAVNGEPFCVYQNRPEIKLLLKQATGLSLQLSDTVPTYEELRTMNAPQFPSFQAAKEDFEKNMPLVLAQIDKESQLADAFRQLQQAENVRDQSPQAYQDARNRYYTLANGETWVEEEKQRIGNVEANPKVNHFAFIQNDLKTRLNQQRQTIDVVTGVKDKVLSMRDEFAYTTNAFSKQISDLRNQIQIEKKKSLIEKVEVFSYVDLFLNILITILFLGFFVIVIRKVMPKSPTPQQAYRPTKPL